MLIIYTINLFFDHLYICVYKYIYIYIHNFILFRNFWQNGRWWPFWMSANNFQSHFWPFQIDTQLFFFWNCVTKWLLPAAILHRSEITRNAIESEIRTSKMADVSHFVKNFKKKIKLCIDLKWPEMRSKVIF